MSDGYGREPGLELTTGGCEHVFARPTELDLETRMKCYQCSSILPRRRGFRPGGRRGRERAELLQARADRKGERDRLKDRRSARRETEGRVRAAAAEVPTVRTVDVPRGRYAATALAA